MINVLGDALAAGIMAHVCRKDFAQDSGTEVRAVPPSPPGHPKTPAVEPGGMGTNLPLTSWEPSANPSVPPCLNFSSGTGGD